MRIIFAGTPDYAVPSLNALAGLGPDHEVVAVVTQPDRPRRRSKELQQPPVKSAALALGLKPECIYQPQSINQPEILQALRDLEPDLFFVVAYGGLLKREALELPRHYSLNAHGSLLPRYRGAAPLQAAILAGDEQTGVSIMEMAEKLDAGPVMLQRETPILPDDTAGTLHDRMASLSAVCFLDAVRFIEEGHVHFAPQDESLVSYAPKLSKTSGQVDWTRPAEYLERFVRAMSPWPGTWTTLGGAAVSKAEGEKVKVDPLRIRLVRATMPRQAQAASNGKPGVACVSLAKSLKGGGDERVFQVRCGDGKDLLVYEVQAAGGKAMPVAQFLRGAGRAFEDGACFGA